jgi:polysaccharide export outer membrane protein
VVITVGSINYSYLGDVQVAGKSPSELEEHIVNLLQNGYLVNPSVNVAVMEYRPFYINGEIRSPGSYPYQPGLTLDKAIALAGGLTDRASTRKMFVTSGNRSSGETTQVFLSSKVAPGDIITINEGFF